MVKSSWYSWRVFCYYTGFYLDICEMHSCTHMPKARQMYIHAVTVHPAQVMPQLGSFRPAPPCNNADLHNQGPGPENTADPAMVASCFPSHWPRGRITHYGIFKAESPPQETHRAGSANSVHLWCGAAYQLWALTYSKPQRPREDRLLCPAPRRCSGTASSECHFSSVLTQYISRSIYAVFTAHSTVATSKV